MTIPERKSRTDWERVKQIAAEDGPIPYAPEDGPYDPNDEAATTKYFEEATILVGWPDAITVRKDGIPVPASKRRAPAPKAKAS